MKTTLIALAAAGLLGGAQAAATSTDQRRAPSELASSFQFDGPESSDVKDVAKIALTGRPVDGLPTATTAPSKTESLRGGTVTNTAPKPNQAPRAAASTLPEPGSALLLLAGLLAVVSLVWRRGRH